MAYEKLGRGGCIGLGLFLLIVGIVIAYWISSMLYPYPPPQTLQIIIPLTIIDIFFLVLAGSFIRTGVFYIPPLPSVTPRTCPQCGRGLTTFPADIKNCPYCGQKLE